MKILSRLTLPAVSICLLLLLAACGAKGPLFLPEEPAQAEEVDADAEALPVPAGDAVDGQSSDAAASDSLSAVPEVDTGDDADEQPGDRDDADASQPAIDGEPAPVDESGND